MRRSSVQIGSGLRALVIVVSAIAASACGGGNNQYRIKTGSAGYVGTQGTAGGGGALGGSSGSAGAGDAGSEAGGAAAGAGGGKVDRPDAASDAPTSTSGAAGAGGAAGSGASKDAAVETASDAGADALPWELMYPRDKRRMLLRDEGLMTLHYVNLANPTENWTITTTDPARGMQLVGGGVLFGARNDGYEEYDLETGKVLKQVKGFTQTESACRLANGQTMLTQLDKAGIHLTFLEPKTDVVKSQITYAGYGYVRMARPTPQGTFLVPSDTKLFEGDDKGNVMWETTLGSPEWMHIWKATRVPNGNVVLGAAWAASLDILDATSHKVIQRIGTAALPEAATVKPNFFAEFQILPNGNYVTPNWEGHGPGNGGTGVQVLEFDPTGKLVWQWKQDPAVYSSIQAVMILDGLDPQYLHVETVDGTWTPVK
jgi:hypothetical protein